MCDDIAECICCIGPRGRRGKQGERGPAGVFAQDVLPFANRFVSIAGPGPEYAIQIANNFGETENFTQLTPPQPSFAINNSAIFTPTVPMIVNINALFEFSYNAPPTQQLGVVVFGVDDTTYLSASATPVLGAPNYSTVAINGEVVVSPQYPLRMQVITLNVAPLSIFGSLTSELVRYL